MPAIMVLRAQDNSIPQSPGRWLAGESVTNTEMDHTFSFAEMPINVLGTFTVAQTNAQDINTIPIYGSIKLSDSGVVTIGTQGPLAVSTDDIIVKTFGDVFINYGPHSIIPTGFYHLRIDDKTQAEVEEFLQDWNKILEYQSLQYNPVDDMRRVEVTNLMTSVSGLNGFTDEGTQAVVDEWNGTRISWDAFTFVMDAILPIES
jgi:hypothetical protein